MEEVHHVWFFNGQRLPQSEPTVWLEKGRSFIEDISSELDWLRSQKEGSKILGPEWTGSWTVRIYDERPDQKPLGEMSFLVK